jgi:DNA-binding MurR/RpiR family transcriptional regulator
MTKPSLSKMEEIYQEKINQARQVIEECRENKELEAMEEAVNKLEEMTNLFESAIKNN